MTIQSSNDYATVMLVALDNQPLNESKRVLVQVGTTARPTGWIGRDDVSGRRRQADLPWQAGRRYGQDALGHSRCPDHADGGELRPHGGNATRHQWQPADETQDDRPGPGGSLHLPKDALYVVLEAK